MRLLVKTFFLERARAVAAVADEAAQTEAIKAAVTYVLRGSGVEHPDRELDDHGRWMPSGRDAAVFLASSPVGITGPKAMRTCRSLHHCAALFDADVALTRKYARIFRSEKSGSYAAALRTLPPQVSAKLFLDALTA